MNYIKYIFSTILFLLFFLINSNNIHAASNISLENSSSWNILLNGGTNAYIGGSVIRETDIDGDGANDLLIGADYESYGSRSAAGSVYIIYNSLLSSLSGTGNTIDLSNPSNYNIRIVGALNNERIGFPGNFLLDVNSDGLKDLVIGTYVSDYNSRDGSGSIYIIYNSIFANLSGTGNILDLSSTSNYSLRFDGETAGDHLGDTDTISMDFDNNNINDLVIGAPWYNYGAGSDNGAVYFIPDSIIDNYSGSGNNIDLAVNSNYKTKFVGGSGSYLGHFQLNAADITNDGKADLIVASPNANTNTGYLYIIANNLIIDYPGTGNLIDLTNTSNFNLRIGGPDTNSFLANGPIFITDYNLDNKKDILVGAPYTFQAHVGYIYLLLNSLLDDYFSTTGNSIDLSNSSNFNLRIDGDTQSVHFPSMLSIADYNGDGKPDILTNDVYGSPNGIQYAGYVYLIYNNLSQSDTSVGNIISIANNNYAVRYSGAAAWNTLGYFGLGLYDYNNDDRPDVSFSSYLYNYFSNKSGAFWIIYNFPHTISLSNVTSYLNVSKNPITGSISAINSTTNIAGVEFSVDSNSISGTWSACTASDGNFNSTTENFSCSPTGLSDALHTIYIRAYDTNNSYTFQSKYPYVTFISDSESPTSFTIESPSTYSLYNSNPKIVFKKSSDKSLSSYSVILDSGRNRNFVVDNIPISGNGSANYVWKNDRQVRIEFLNEETSDTSDDLILVYFKTLDNQELSEGEHTLKINAYDLAGNTRSQTLNFYVDKTSPKILDFAIANLNTVEGGKYYKLPAKFKQFSLSGNAVDLYNGSYIKYANGLSDTFDKISSGPKSIILKIDKKVKNKYIPYLEKEYLLQQNEIIDLKNIEKSLRFYITLPHPLSNGLYKISTSLKDNSDNTYDFPDFYINLNYFNQISFQKDDVTNEKTEAIKGESSILGKSYISKSQNDKIKPDNFFKKVIIFLKSIFMPS